MAMVLVAGFAMSASAEETTEATTEIATEAVAGDAAVIRIGSLKGYCARSGQCSQRTL